MAKTLESGHLITIEGQDGAGKTTNIQLIKNILEDSGKTVICTREPGGTPLGEMVRDTVLNNRSLNIHPMAELLLIFAARAQHVEQVIAPALTAGTWVLCDRFTDATYAYQGGGRGIDLDFIAQLENQVQGLVRPSLTLLLDIDPSLGNERVERRSEPDRFEREALAFKRRVRKTYLTLAQQSPERIKLIDASKPIEVVEKNVENIIKKFVFG